MNVDGSRIIASDGVIRRASTDPLIDLQQLTSFGETRGFAELPAKAEYYTADVSVAGSLGVYDSNTFALKRTFSLPSVPSGAGTTGLGVRFLFADPATNLLYVLAQDVDKRAFLVIVPVP
jgi:hypothetical protein